MCVATVVTETSHRSDGTQTSATDLGLGRGGSTHSQTKDLCTSRKTCPRRREGRLRPPPTKLPTRPRVSLETASR
jgi:hypothetical protein